MEIRFLKLLNWISEIWLIFMRFSLKILGNNLLDESRNFYKKICCSMWY